MLYLGGYIGSDANNAAWMEDKVELWVHSIEVLERIGQHYPQSAYYGMSMSLQNEWQRVCPIVPGAGLMLGPVEEALKSFLFTLLEFGRDERGNLRELLGHRVKMLGLAFTTLSTSMLPSVLRLLRIVCHTSPPPSSMATRLMLTGMPR